MELIPYMRHQAVRSPVYIICHHDMIPSFKQHHHRSDRSHSGTKGKTGCAIFQICNHGFKSMPCWVSSPGIFIVTRMSSLLLLIRTRLIDRNRNGPCMFIGSYPAMNQFCLRFHLLPLLYLLSIFRKIALLKYRSLLSGKTVTIVVPSSACSASFNAANMAEPEELPTSSPSLRASAATIENASLSETV